MRKTTVEQELSENSRCMIRAAGDSMEPLLHDGGIVVLEKIGENPRLYDIVLFRRTPEEGGEYVLHRIVGIKNGDYLIRGDNYFRTEYVKRGQIIGVVNGFFDGNDYIDCNENKAYARYLKSLRRRYAFVWCKAFPGRAIRKLKRSFS